MSENTLRQALDEYLDWLSDLPEEEIRRKFANMRIPRSVDFNWTIGGTEYIVTSHFSKNSENDMFKIVSRLLECDIIYPLQKSCSGCGNGGCNE